MPRYDEVRCRATHNSYSGNISGRRKALTAQLDAGARCVELDVHDDGFAELGDYRVGHGGPGQEVDHSPDNPDSDLRLTAWLEVLAGWSARCAGHGPITIVLDVKDPLTDNLDGGDLGDLNSILDGVFRTQLYRREHHAGAWPEWTDLRNKFLCVLSGDMKNRMCYRWDFGRTPAVGVNASGDVVLAFAEDSGDLSCWRGTAAPDGTIAWRRRYTYAHSNKALFEPAVAVSDEGWVVCVHRLQVPQIPNGLWYRLGKLGSRGRIDWHHEGAYARGTSPTLKVDGLEVTEIHRQSDTSARLKTAGTIDPAKKRIVWDDPRKTEQQPFPTDRARWSGHTIECGAHRTEGWLGCRFDGAPLAPARYEQVAFVELQGDGELDRLVDPLFFAAPGDSKSRIARARKDGYVARGWGFARRNAQDPADPRENFPATDTPFEPWYEAYVPPVAEEGAAARAARPSPRGRARSRGAKTRAKTTRAGSSGEGRSRRPRQGRARKAE